jgi:hypothetical protein
MNEFIFVLIFIYIFLLKSISPQRKSARDPPARYLSSFRLDGCTIHRKVSSQPQQGCIQLFPEPDACNYFLIQMHICIKLPLSLLTSHWQNT